MSKKISELPLVGPPAHSDELVINQGGISKKVNIAQILHDTTFDEEEHLMSMAFRNPHRFITYYNDFNKVPFWTVGPAPGPGHHHELYAYGQGTTDQSIYTPFVGQASVNSSLSFETGGATGDCTILTPADIIAFGGSWLWRIEDKHEFILACGFTWSGAANSIYKIGAAQSVGELRDIDTTTFAPRFESRNGETMKFKWGNTTPGVEHIIDTGILGTGVAGDVQGAESSMHTFLAHHKDGIVRVFADKVLVGTTVPKLVGHNSDQSFMLGCGVDAPGAGAVMNVDYFMLAVQRSGQLAT